MTAPTVSFVSLGCPKNLVDSEKMLGLLAEAGCGIVGSGGGADVLVVNTCGFLAASRDEAIEVLQDAAQQKRRGKIRRLVVAGCLVQRDGQTLAERVPEIDALVGVNNRADIVRAVTGGRARPARRTRAAAPTVRTSRAAGDHSESAPAPGGGASAAAGTREIHLGEYHPQTWSDRARLRLTPAHYAYLRISEGCNQKCTFCTIPSIRGPMHCKPVDEILAEARELIADGAREINLLGQDTTSYSDVMRRDGPSRARTGDTLNLAGLLRRLDRVDGARWIRLMYAYPTDFTDEMIDAIAECEHVVKYIDLPLQHIHDRVLRAMHRRVTRRETESLLARLRRRVPGISIRTTFIAGSPGESDAEFEELRQFIADFEFDAVGVFAYSFEPDTPAGRMKHQVEDAIKQQRVAALMAEQQRVAFRRAAAMKGRELRVMIDGFGRGGVYPARHQGQAPEVDSVVHVSGGEFDPGDFVNVRCTGSRDYDLLARPAGMGLPILQAHG